jgi:glycosyltransferase involved in cell wall biosynthesis
MKIGFDAKRYFHNKSGLGNYSRDLLNAMFSEHAENEYFLFDKRPYDFSTLPHIHVVKPNSSAFLWRENGILNQINAIQLDVYHGLSNELPFGNWHKDVKKIVTIHDAIFKRYPADYPIVDRWIYDKKTTYALKKADIIIATSHATAQDLDFYYRFDTNKIKVIYQSCGPEFQKIIADVQLNDFKLKYQLNQDFLLYVSSFQSRKQHLLLLKAFGQLKDKNIQLVLSGRKGETFNTCLEFVKEQGLENRVQFFTDFESADLAKLYRCAKAFVYPSKIEGFGIPLIEAAFASLPVLVNDVPIFNELAPPNSLSVKVEETDHFADKLMTLLEMPKQDYRNYLAQFDARKAMESTLDLYKL